MKLITILGTRPELIRLCQVIPKLDKYCDHKIVWTGQNFDYELSDIFIKQLNIRKPDYHLNIKGTFAEQIGTLLIKLEKIFIKEKPDKFFVLGDTNSSMGAIVAKRLGVKVYHSEAGNRCYDDQTPEEVNRRIIDCSSDILMPYTQDSKERLVKDGVPLNRIFITGNPIFEVIKKYEKNIQNNIKPLNYFLVTLHRQENVDNKERLTNFFSTFTQLGLKYNIPVIISVHPRLKKRLNEFNIPINEDVIKLNKPFGFIEFLCLEKYARCILTDSGTVMEESTILNIPCIVLRDSHERPECQRVGSIILSGCDEKVILSGVDFMISSKCDWKSPYEYTISNVSDIICKIILSK